MARHHRRAHRARFTSLALSIVLSCAVILVVAPPVLASPGPTTPEIEAKKQQAAEAKNTLEELAAELEMRSEEYEQIAAALDDTRAQLDRTRQDLERARTELATAEAHLGDRAAEIYRAGNTNLLEVFLGVRNFSDFLTRVDYLRTVARSDASVVATVRDASSRVELAQRTLETREAEQAVLREQARTKQAQVDGAVQQQQAYIAGLNSEITRLVNEERERQRKIAEERARQAAARAAELAKATAAAAGRRFEPESLGGGHPEVVKIALEYVGVPYIWGGASPETGFDCSGLTQFVYAKAGITIPRSSRSQFVAGAYIPPDRLDALRPGDLVFFGYDADATRIHHVGIYAGAGDFVHAPMTGQDVMVSSLADRIDSRHDYVGACRF